MRKYYALVIAICCTITANAQILNPKELLKQKATDRANNRIDQGIDKGLDKVEDAFKKKEKKPKKSRNNSDNFNENGNNSNGNGNNSNGNGNNNSNGNGNNSNGNGNNNSNGNGNNSNGNSSQTTSFKTYSKFDFVSGEKVLAFDDFATTSVGDFPLGWNTNSTAEIVTVEGDAKKWLFMSKDGFFQPEYVKDMPENFTLEFDVLTRFNSNNILAYAFYLSAVDNPKKDLSNKYIQNGIYFEWQPCGEGASKYIIYEKGERIGENNGLNIKQLATDDCNKPVFTKIAIWRQKTRLRIYAGETKVLDIPQAFDAKLKYNAFKFGSVYMNYATVDSPDEFMVSGVRYAVGSPDMRSKLITDGKLVTRGIVFDVGSDKIKPESFSVLKEIAQILSENPTINVKVVGHTDADGDATKNIALSKKRAEAIKNALSGEFKIAATRMQTDGKGAAEPSEPNTTPQGKANNRRVEFIKL